MIHQEKKSVRKAGAGIMRHKGIILFSVLLLFFCIQQYILFFHVIPETLSPFNELPKIQSLVEKALEKMWVWMMVWPLILLSSLLIDCLKKKKD